MNTAAFWIAFATSAILAWPVLAALRKLNSRQTISEYVPEGHRVKQGTPTMGGLIPLFGIAAAFVYYLMTYGLGDGPRMRPVSTYALLALGFALIGFIDDFVIPRMTGRRGLGWKSKIVMQLAFAIVALAIDPSFRSPLWLAFGVFIVLLFSNAYNFSDGLDGLAGTLGLLIAGCLALMTAPGVTGTSLPHEVHCLAMIALTAGLLPFLILNAPPARAFMGDVGSLPIGALLGYACLFLIRTYPSVSTYVVLSIMSLVMLAEIIPPPLQIFWVKVFKKRLFPYTPIHHAFEKAGWPESRIVWMFAIIQFVLIAAALTLLAEPGLLPSTWRHHDV